MARKKDFITEKEYNEAVRRFHNGLNYTEHIKYIEPLRDRVTYDPRLVEESLIEGEQYTVLRDSYIVTSFGRVCNIRFNRWLKPKFYTSNIYIFCGETTYRLEPTFKKMGWRFDKVEILNRYITNNWSRKIIENCQYAYLAK